MNLNLKVKKGQTEDLNIQLVQSLIPEVTSASSWFGALGQIMLKELRTKGTLNEI